MSTEPLPFPTDRRPRRPDGIDGKPNPVNPVNPDNLAVILEEIAAISDRLESLGILVLAEMERQAARETRP